MPSHLDERVGQAKPRFHAATVDRHGRLKAPRRLLVAAPLALGHAPSGATPGEVFAPPRIRRDGAPKALAGALKIAARGEPAGAHAAPLGAGCTGAAFVSRVAPCALVHLVSLDKLCRRLPVPADRLAYCSGFAQGLRPVRAAAPRSPVLRKGLLVRFFRLFPEPAPARRQPVGPPLVHAGALERVRGVQPGGRLERGQGLVGPPHAVQRPGALEAPRSRLGVSGAARRARPRLYRALVPPDGIRIVRDGLFRASLPDAAARRRSPPLLPLQRQPVGPPLVHAGALERVQGVQPGGRPERR